VSNELQIGAYSISMGNIISEHDDRVPRRGSVHSRIGEFHNNASSVSLEKNSFSLKLCRSKKLRFLL